jgi:ABC-type multidrug transport system fused ATPase/permease subunit
MKESHFFNPIRDELERKNSKKVEPITADEHEEVGAEPKPMTVKDHWLSLRQAIQDLTLVEEEKKDGEKLKLLNELITPELLARYSGIMRMLNTGVVKSEEHPERGFVDIESKEISLEIETWIGDLIKEIQVKNPEILSSGGVEELRNQCWIFFDSLGNVMNTKALEKDVADFYKENKNEFKDKKIEKEQEETLLKDLQARYPIDEVELKMLVKLIKSEGKDKEYSFRILSETISRLWGEYGLNEKKGQIAKISAGYLMAKGLESFSPSLFQNIMVHDKFDLTVALEFFGLNKISSLIDARTRIELFKVMEDIRHQINERITNSLFFQEFEFIHEKNLGDIFTTLERGKMSTGQILQDVISEFTPTLTGIAMSLGFLTKINPILGAVGVSGLPVMYMISKRQNEQSRLLREKERKENEKIATRIGAVKDGFEVVKSSSETPEIATYVTEQMNTRDTLSTKRAIQYTKMRLIRMIPFDVTGIIAAAVGGVLQQTGEISGGAILSNISYSDRLNRPVRDMVEMYFNRFADCVRDIQRMEEVFGQYEKLDLPEGEKEGGRQPVSDLENFDISVKDLRYKNILRGVNLEIKQGEFVTISGASGAGKSTLLRNIVGLYKPNGGQVEIGGIRQDKIKRYGDQSIYSVMSYCNQNPQIFPGMNLRENLLLWSKKDVDDERIKKILVDLHLEKFADKLDEEVKNLSGGEKVRIGVARTLIKGAKIMLLDEPTASLDSQSATEVINAIKEISQKYPDTTIVCVSHDDTLLNASDRTIDISSLHENS